MTESYPFPTSADQFADKRVLVTGGTRGIGEYMVAAMQIGGSGAAWYAFGPQRAARQLSGSMTGMWTPD